MTGLPIFHSIGRSTENPFRGCFSPTHFFLECVTGSDEKEIQGSAQGAILGE